MKHEKDGRYREKQTITLYEFKTSNLIRHQFLVQDLFFFYFFLLQTYRFKRFTFSRPDGMSPGHFSHHASLSVKGWWFGWIPELTVLSSAVSRGMQLLFQSYVTSNKSDSSNLCTVDTSRGCSLIQLKQWREHVWEKRKLTFTLRSPPLTMRHRSAALTAALQCHPNASK